MPTGYTYPVAEGKVDTLTEFALQCARAFGACVTMRDDPSNKPIPEEFKPSSYYQEKLDETQAAIAELEGYSAEELVVAAQADFIKLLQQHEEYERSEELAEQRITAMEEKVRAWVAPTPDHTGLKDFMLQQLSISHQGSYRSKPPLQLTPSEWKMQRLQVLHKDLDYYQGEYAKELKRVENASAWVKALRASL